MRNKENKSVTILPFVILTLTLIILFCLLLGLGLFTLLYEPFRTQLDTISWCIIGTVCIGCPLLVIIGGGIRSALSIIKVDEKGVKLLAFGFIKLLEMQWDNIAEIRYYERFVPFIFISKTRNLEAKTYDYITRQKDVIQIQLNKKVHDVICKYAQQPIIDLTEEKLSQLKLK